MIGTHDPADARPGKVIPIDNIQAETDPGFVDASNRDFNLVATSSQVDEGTFVAHAIADGSGVTIIVDDASWFYDGFGIAGETGDIIRIQGQSRPVRIISVDYESNSLRLSDNIAWSKGDGVHLDYSGKAPDVGAFEYVLHPAQEPEAPREQPPE